MYAVFLSGGKQYRVKVGQTLKLEKLEANPGDELKFDQVLMTGNEADIKIGAPYLADCSVNAMVLNHGRKKKIRIIKMKRRKHHRKQMGHRQWYTELQITSIGG